MFLQCKSGYDKDGQQRASGPFLIVAQKPGCRDLKPELRAVVRHVSMKQLGHFMMASVKLGGFNICLSGTYGSDGLPVNFGQHFIDHEPVRFTEEQANALFDAMVPLPEELQAAFWAGGGHNTGGKELEQIRQWAKANVALLRRPIRTPA